MEPNLKLLKIELDQYPAAQIITLGEPVLKLLIRKGKPNKMVYYWDYNEQTKSTNGDLKYCSESDNTLGRILYPIPHQPSINKTFYSSTFNDYLSFIKK